MEHISISYEDLFEFLELEDNYNEYLFPNKDLFKDEIYVETPEHGLQEILSYVRKDKHNIVRVELACGRQIEVSENHVVRENGNEVNVMFANYIDTNDGMSKVVSREIISTSEDVYDISINSPHWFYDANGVIHHNSLFGSSIASNMLLNKQNVLVVTLEMSDFEYLKRVDANVLDIGINEFYSLDENVIKQRFDSIRDKIGKLKSVEYPAGRFSALQLENLLDNLRNTENFEPDIIIIDYLALMKSDRYSSITNTNSYFTSVAEDIRAIAQTKNIPIVSFSQLTRGSGNDGATSFDQSQISLAKGIYEASDTFSFIMNNAEMKEEGEIAIIVDKNRNTGMTGNVLMLDINYKKMRISDNQELPDKVDGMKSLELANEMSTDVKLNFGEFNF